MAPPRKSIPKPIGVAPGKIYERKEVFEYLLFNRRKLKIKVAFSFWV
jgi:hypothetical protein